MSPLTLLVRPLRAALPAALLLLGLAATPRALAVTNDELIPANLVGKTLTFTYGAGTPNTLEAINNFTLQFTTGSTYVRSATGLATEGGTYTVLDSSIAASTGNRATTIQINNNWFSPGSTTAVLLVLTQQNGFGAYAASEFFNPFKTTGGLFTIGGSTSGGGSGGGGGTTTVPTITNSVQQTATVGAPFSLQLTTSTAATSFENMGGNAPIAINPTSGLVTGTFTAAGTFTFSVRAINAGGPGATVVFSVTVSGGSTGGGGGSTLQLGAGLVAYYKFENNTNDSAGTNHGTQQGGLTYAASRSGFGQAASFSGVNQYITIPHSAALNIGTTGLTVSMWVNTANPKAASNGSRLLDKQTSGVADGWSFDTYDLARQSRNVVRVASSTAGFNSTRTFTPSTWQHLAFVYNAGTVTFYINGVASGSGPVGNLINNTLPLQIGGPRGTLAAGEYFAGLMDEIRIYSRTLTLGEIGNLSEGDQSTGGLTGGGGGGGGGTVTFATAPLNLVGYRNKVGQTYQFTVTGATGGAVWGTDVYTDDSSVARAAVHAGLLAVGETKNVTITLLGGQASYGASTRNGVTTSSWGAWPGSFAFSGASGGTATSRPAIATGFVAGSGTLALGGRFVCPITVTGGGTYTYQWYRNGLAIAGATANPYVVEVVGSGDAGTYTVDVTNALGTTRLTAGSLTVGAAGSPVITLQPLSKVVVPGATVSFATSATGTGLAYQWFRNNVALAGETGAILLRQNVNAADAGTYSVRVSNGSGSLTSSGGTLTLSANASRPANISVRTRVATGATVIPGFVIQGTGNKRVLIRAVGPGLAPFGLTGLMSDPKLTVYQGSTRITENDDWSATNVGNAFAATGAFVLPSGSKDAALVTDLAAGRDYTVQVTNATGTGGIVLIEVYDADSLTGTTSSKLVNVSVRGQTAPGDDVLTLGLVIGGTGQRTLLVRGIGPKLAAFGVTGTVADPRLQIFDSQQRAILANDNWNNADFVNELTAATGYVGAFALDSGSQDAATLSLVEPGAYTIQVSGAAASPTGEALVEVYEVP
ncbi:LamG-like jellyroll fold domain-containing protein [Horticoccus sp. 23ND18S-11]|uniref:LamG-like jellyroll fold domain-containing protein n=1 Tax=Horticoccus sp. 23ND18S-11 TaxID=3391832 RepID=UPI0039C99D91